MKTKEQNRKIWGIAAVLGLEEEDLRDLVQGDTGGRKISILTYAEAAKVIRRLHSLLPGGPGYRRQNGGASGAQLRMIRELYEAIGWNVSSFRVWLRGYNKVESEQWLKREQAQSVIEALKAMIRRGFHARK
jgi:hypothetical protein